MEIKRKNEEKATPIETDHAQTEQSESLKFKKVGQMLENSSDIVVGAEWLENVFADN